MGDGSAPESIPPRSRPVSVKVWPLFTGEFSLNVVGQEEKVSTLRDRPGGMGHPSRQYSSASPPPTVLASHRAASHCTVLCGTVDRQALVARLFFLVSLNIVTIYETRCPSRHAACCDDHLFSCWCRSHLPGPMMWSLPGKPGCRCIPIAFFCIGG